MDLLVRHRLGASAMMILLLCQKESVSMTQIANKCGFSTANATGTVDPLERRKLVERRHDPTDRRKVFVSLTDAGRRILSQILKQPHAPTS